MKQKDYNILVVAHPDDETIFFAGLLQSLNSKPWIVICVTDADADGQGALRLSQFKKATKALGVKKSLCLGFPDIYEERLDVQAVARQLQELTHNLKIHRIYSHGIIGEYGHPHHQDVAAAVNLAFPKQQIWSTAYNCFAEEKIILSSAQYVKKTKLLSQVYLEETRRFANFLPATFCEGFVRIPRKEVNALYNFFTQGKTPRLSDLKVYRWYWPYIAAQKKKSLVRPF